jgi:hypothetical protein
MREVMAMAGAAGLSCAAAGQDVVVFERGTETRQVEAACFALFGHDCPRVFSARDLADRLDAGVTVALIEIYFDLPQADKDLLLPALERHIDRGGRLILAYTELDQWPELQELVGVRAIGDVTVITGRHICTVEPQHPTWVTLGPCMRGGEDYWLDNGDLLEVDDGYVLADWKEPVVRAAMALTRNGRVFVDAFDFDAFDGWAIDERIAAQIEWLLGCPADLDGDGELTFFDFLAFQNLFVAGDLRADFAFDGQLDFFDFLEFQEQFTIGCP